MHEQGLLSLYIYVCVCVHVCVRCTGQESSISLMTSSVRMVFEAKTQVCCVGPLTQDARYHDITTSRRSHYRGSLLIFYFHHRVHSYYREVAVVVLVSIVSRVAYPFDRILFYQMSMRRLISCIDLSFYLSIYLSIYLSKSYLSKNLYHRTRSVFHT
jgi:hypothetical protein